MNSHAGGEQPAGADDSAQGEALAKPNAAKPSALRLWMFRIIAATVVPVLLLGAIELGLRIAGYGYPTNFFVKIEGGDAYTSNLWFGWRFFPREISRQPQPIYLPRDKADGTYRIFILGGSAAQGVPDPAFSFGRILEAMLEETHPAAKFEVVNAAMTAINSHVTLPMARDCAKHDPDLFIVYMGNNEVIGPFGAGTVFQGFTSNLSLIRANIALREVKLVQLAEDIARRPSGRSTGQRWGGLEMFAGNLVPADDPRLEAHYQHFRRNLHDISQAARKADAETILCTVAVNLRHCPPFASAHRPGLSRTKKDQWGRSFRAGVELERSGNPADAVTKYLAAAKIDDRHAELHFRLARCYLALEHPGIARHAFALARDLDALRFRADSRINDIIREVANDEANDGVHLVDAERALAMCDRAPDGLPGEELFFEHVHLTFEGNYELAKAILPKVVELLPEDFRSGHVPVAVPSIDRCAQRLGLTAWHRGKMLSYMLAMMGRPPFTEQPDDADRRAAIARSLRQVTEQIGPSTADEIRRALAEDEDDLVIRLGLGRFLLLTAGKHKEAEEHFRIVLRRLPNDPTTHLYLGQALLAQAKVDQADHHFARAVELSPNTGGACAKIAGLLLDVGRLDQAAEYCHQSLEALPDNPDALAVLGQIHLLRKQWRQAAEYLAGALQAEPDNVPVRQNLALSLYSLGRLDQAAKHYQKTIKLKPDDLALRRNYAIVLVAMKDLVRAADQYRKMLELQPDSPEAMANLAWMLAVSTDASVRNLPEALALAQRAAQLTGSREASVLDTLAVVYAETGRFDLAIETAAKAEELATSAGQENHARLIRRRIELYRQNKPLSQQLVNAVSKVLR